MAGYGFPNSTDLLMYYVMPQVALGIYLLLLWDVRRTGSPTAGDDQLGVKTVAAALAITGVFVAASGGKQLLHVLLTFSDFAARTKAAVPDIAAGGVAVLVGLLVIMPRTNIAQYPKASRLVAGAVATGGAVACVGGLATLLRNVLTWSSWDPVAQALSSFVVAALVLAAGLGKLMAQSGVVMAAPAMRPGPPQQRHPPQTPPSQGPGGPWPQA